MEEIQRWTESGRDWSIRMLGEIDESMQNRYYPFILDEISDFYDRVRIISVSIGKLREL